MSIADIKTLENWLWEAACKAETARGNYTYIE